MTRPEELKAQEVTILPWNEKQPYKEDTGSDGLNQWYRLALAKKTEDKREA